MGLTLRDGDWSYVNLRGVDLTSADLRATHLEGADLSDADRIGANLAAAPFDGVHRDRSRAVRRAESRGAQVG